MSRRDHIGMGSVLIFAGIGLLISDPAMLHSEESKQDEMAGMEMPGMKVKEEKKPASAKKSVGAESAREPQGVPGTVTIPPERLQTIGVKYGQVTRRPLETTIRTVGRVAVDERRRQRVGHHVCGARAVVQRAQIRTSRGGGSSHSRCVRSDAGGAATRTRAIDRSQSAFEPL